MNIYFKKFHFIFPVLFFFSSFLFAQQSGIDSLKSILTTVSEDIDKVKLLNKITEQYITTASYLQAKPYAEHAVQLAEKLGLKEELAVSAERMGLIFGYVGNYEKALDNYLKALKYWEETGNKQNIIVSYYHIADVHQNQVNYKKQLEVCFKILKIEEEIKDTGGVANSYRGIAGVYYNQCKQALKEGDSTLSNLYYEKIIDFHLKSLKIWEEKKDSLPIASILSGIGFFYDKYNLCEESKLITQSNLIKSDYYKKSEESYLKALRIYQKIGYKDGLMASYFDLGRFYKNRGNLAIEKGDLSQANLNYRVSLENYLKALKYIQERGFTHGIANSCKEIGTVYLKLGKLTEATEYLIKAVNGFKERGFTEGIKDSYSQLSSLYTKKHDYKRALEYYKLYSDIKDTLLNEASSRQMTEMNTKYESEKKDNSISTQNQLLTIKNNSISVRNYFLAGLAGLVLLILILFLRSKSQTKKINRQYGAIQQLQSELTHRTANFFNSIKGMLTVASATTTDSKTLSSLNNRVGIINRLFNTLYSSPEKGQINFSALLESICSDFEHSFGKDKQIRIYQKCSATISKQEAIPLAFIITELLTNAEKYAFEGKEPGEIHVEVAKNNDKRVLHVWDNGKGKDENAATRPGSQGTAIVKSYSKNLGGTISTWNNNGFHFKMDF